MVAIFLGCLLGKPERKYFNPMSMTGMDPMVGSCHFRLTGLGIDNDMFIQKCDSDVLHSRDLFY